AADYIIFFFSSRRRHTRSKRDWSSDVCSSDLFRRQAALLPQQLQLQEHGRQDELREGLAEIESAAQRAAALTRQLLLFSRRQVRSEERRVGKECRSRRVAGPSKEKIYK